MAVLSPLPTNGSTYGLSVRCLEYGTPKFFSFHFKVPNTVYMDNGSANPFDVVMAVSKVYEDVIDSE